MCACVPQCVCVHTCVRGTASELGRNREVILENDDRPEKNKKKEKREKKRKAGRRKMANSNPIYECCGGIRLFARRLKTRCKWTEMNLCCDTCSWAVSGLQRSPHINCCRLSLRRPSFRPPKRTLKNKASENEWLRRSAFMV